MALNPYFLQGSSSEQRLIQDLVNEQLRMYGQDVVYMPRKFISEKTIIKEVILSKFDDSFRIEAYISNSDGFGGQGDILSKFGVRSTDEITFIISKERYIDFITPHIKNDANIKVATRPQEGDLIYFPLDNSLFEIKYVEGKRPFYQLNNLYVYELRCELYEYEDEIIDTGIEEVDKNIQDFGYITTLQMISELSSPAIAGVALTTGYSIQYVDIINGGSGYKSTPSVVFSPPPTGGTLASAVAIMTSRGNNLSIKDILLVNPGSGYTTIPRLTIETNTGTGFIGTVGICSGGLGPIVINSGGVGYSTVPVVSISTSPSGRNASAIALLNSSGIVTAVSYVNTGAGYTVPPTIQFTSPVGIATGNYTYNEVVRGVSTGTSAYVKDWNYDSRILKVSIVNGNFALGETIVGAAASYKTFSIITDDLYDAYYDNDQIEKEASELIDYSEKNPFGIY
jgi:hypothetical protein